MSNWPKGVSGKSIATLEAAGITPEKAQEMDVEELIALGVARTSAKLACKRPVPEHVQLVRSITGRYPPEAIWGAIEEHMDGLTKEQLSDGWVKYVMNGGNPRNPNYAAWLRNCKLAAQGISVPLPNFMRPKSNGHLPEPVVDAVDKRASELAAKNGWSQSVAYRVALTQMGQ